MKKFDVVTIGSATRDALFRSDTFPVIDDPEKGSGKALLFHLGSKIRIEDVFFGTGGAGTNTAVTFTRQKFRTGCVINIGDDVSGKEIRSELTAEGIDTSFVRTDPEEATGYSVILEPESGERVILKHRGANDNLSGKHIPFSDFQASWLYLSSLSADTTILEQAIACKEQQGTRLAWNPGGMDLALGREKLEPYLHAIDVFIVNQEEASNLLDIPYTEKHKIFREFDSLIEGIAVMTMGPEGVLVSDGTTIWNAGVYQEKQVIDRTGAGDSFGSGFVAGLIRALPDSHTFTSESIEYALRLGSANATAKVEDIGAKTGLLTKDAFESQSRWNELPFSTETI